MSFSKLGQILIRLSLILYFQYCTCANKSLYVADLDLGFTLRKLLDNAIKPNTKRTYSSAQKRFIKFCVMYDLDPLPASEDTVLYYISFLFRDGLKGSSIRVYLSGLRNLHI